MAGVSGAWMSMTTAGTQLAVDSGLFRCLPLLLVALLSVGSAAARTSFHDLLWPQGIIQTETCGPTVLATLINSYYGQDPGVIPGDLFSMADLGRFAQGLGFHVYPVRMDEGGIKKYLTSLRPPLIVHLARPEPHYVLALGLEGEEQVTIIDPDWGLLALPLTTLLHWWSGFTLIIHGPGGDGLWVDAQRAVVQGRLDLLGRLKR
ncbi:MAG: cysteine peptidase family C39 domain-containing protein [Limnochordia bacterium]